MRDLHASTVIELEKDQQYIINFIEFHLENKVYLTTAHTDLTVDLGHGEGTKQYVSGSDLITFGNVTESQTLDISSMSFVLSAVDQTNLVTALGQDTINRQIKLYRGLLDTSNYALVADPILLYVGNIKSFDAKETPGDTATLTWATASAMADFNGTAGRRTNQEDQDAFLAITQPTSTPVDLGFEFAGQLEVDVQWGQT